MIESEREPHIPRDEPQGGIGEWIQRHSYRGRYEEYMRKFGPYMEDVQNGLEGYELATRLDADAKRYAVGHVARDVVITTAIAGGVLYLGRETLRGRLIRDIGEVTKRVLTVPDTLINVSDKAFQWAGNTYDSVRDWARSP